MSAQRQQQNYSLLSDRSANVLNAASARATIFELKRERTELEDRNARLLDHVQRLRDLLEMQQAHNDRMSDFVCQLQLKDFEKDKKLSDAESLIKGLKQELRKYKGNDDMAAQIRKGPKLF